MKNFMKIMLVVFGILLIPAIAFAQGTGVIPPVTFDWTALAMQALQILAPIVVGLIATLVGLFLKWLMQKIKNDKINSVLGMVEGVFGKVALQITDSYVKGLKLAGKIDADAQKQAMQMAIKAFIDYVGQKGADEFAKSIGFKSISEEGAQKAVIARIETAHTENKVFGTVETLLKTPETK